MFTVEEFANMTMKIIANDGFDGYLPTAIYPARRNLVVLEGVPENSDIEHIAFKWASNGAIDDEEFLVAFKISSSSFKVIRQYEGVKEDGVFDVSNNNT
ncbi:MAG: hypothetical protein B7Y56_15895 [Gallionellales bacterium 35-53-114]|jgi:hypothetical protein|nr:MAG: hypothetical protein B7Y56_15895 [Gallionellales bacterium 35-53-114]HQS60017.1 hypothetical protein [Gallionellaceae bacterium]